MLELLKEKNIPIISFLLHIYVFNIYSFIVCVGNFFSNTKTKFPVYNNTPSWNRQSETHANAMQIKSDV